VNYIDTPDSLKRGLLYMRVLIRINTSTIFMVSWLKCSWSNHCKYIILME